MDRAGLPFVLWPLAAAAVCAGLGTWWAAGTLAVAAVALGLFFRDPDRTLPEGVEGDTVVAPADGRVVHAGEAVPQAAPPGRWRQVSIFLSPLDVHVNRVPVGGRVLDVTCTKGRFWPAYDPRSAMDNERSEVRIDRAGQTVIFRQVVGVLARRVVCRLTPGMTVTTGERFGIMKFGSRMDVFLPHSATLDVTGGESVRGGETVIARLVADAAAGGAPVVTKALQATAGRATPRAHES